MMLNGLESRKRFEFPYVMVNPMGKIPGLMHYEYRQTDRNIFESHAIMQYVCELKKLPDHWYPTSPGRDIQLKAKMDMYLNWHHEGMGGNKYFFNKYVSGLCNRNGVWASDSEVKRSYDHLIESLTYISEIWLKPNRGTKFMFGDDPSIADLSLFA